MAALGCNVASLLSLAQCTLCLTESELLAAEVLLREQIYADGEGVPPRSLQTLLIAANVWRDLSEHQRQAIEVRELCNDAVDAGARTSCDAGELQQETKCYCAPQNDLKAVIAYLKCLERQS